MTLASLYLLAPSSPEIRVVWSAIAQLPDVMVQQVALWMR
jgi:hypothetical protein